MSDLFINFFADWQNVTADVYEESTVTDMYGNTSTERTLVDTDLPCGQWIERAQVTDQSDKFVGEEIGKFLIEPPVYDIDTTYVFSIAGMDYYITGVDNVGEFGEVMILDYRKETL